jgi:SIT family siderophore-iron:H+ symporter-like MFS transporter
VSITRCGENPDPSIVSTLLLVGMLFLAQHRASKAGHLAAYKTPFQQLGWGLFKQLFWQLDVIGIILMIAAFALFLVPFTLAGGASETWKTAHIIAPLVIGVICFPIFAFWESRCKYPLIPFRVSNKPKLCNAS